MGELLETLNANAGALTVLFSGVVTAATVAYVCLTWRMVVETRELRRAQTEPRIGVTVEPFDFSINIVRLRIRNIGLGPAFGVSFETRVLSGGKAAEALLADFTQSNFFRTGVGYIGPGSDVWSTYSQIHLGPPNKLEAVLLVTVRYTGVTKGRYEEKLQLDMHEMQGAYQLGKPHLYAISQTLERLQKDLHGLATGFKRLDVDVFDSSDREAEQKAKSEWLAKQRAAAQQRQEQQDEVKSTDREPPPPPG